MPVVWKQAKRAWKKVPVTKRQAREANRIDPRTGKPYIMVLPADLYRNYDEAYINVLHMRKEEGFRIPKRQSTAGGDETCEDTPLGLLLGFAFGLQYDTKTPGECYNNLETSILALDSILQLWWLVLLPEKAPKVLLAGQDFITVTSSLYGTCQIQVFFQTVSDMLSQQGMTGLFSRTIGGLQSELPFYATKSQYAASPCIRGESLGRIVQLIFAYSI